VPPIRRLFEGFATAALGGRSLAARSQSNIPVTKAAITAPSKSIVAPSRIKAVAIEHLPGKEAIQVLGGEFPGFNGTLALCGFLCPWFQVLVSLSWGGLVARRDSSKGFSAISSFSPRLTWRNPRFHQPGKAVASKNHVGFSDLGTVNAQWDCLAGWRCIPGQDL
jgi:hypothetical protein